MIDLSWLDSRIEFHNIKPLQSQNSLLESVSEKIRYLDNYIVDLITARRRRQSGCPK